MYLRLLYHANQGRYKTVGGAWVFPKWVSVPTGELMKLMGIKHRNTLYKIRDELTTAGYIRFRAEIGAATTEYLLVQLLTAEERKQTEMEIGHPFPTPVRERQGSFDTDEFFAAALRASLGDDA